MKKLLLLVAAIILIASCTQSTQKESTSTTEKVFKVKVEEARKQPVSQTVTFSGNIEPYVKNNISSSSAQRIEKIYVEVGDKVAKGQLLVKMENLSYAQSKIQVDNLKADFARTEALYKAGGISAQQYEQVKTQVKVAEESLSNLDKNTKLLSPINGVVSQRNFDNGDLTMGQPILTVMQLQPVKIVVNVSEEYFPLTKIGTPVTIDLDVYEGKTFNGKVSLIYPTIDPGTKTFSSVVTINNNNLQLRPGMFARATVNFGDKSRVIVSDKAIIKESGTNNKYVYVLNGDKVVYTKVELGRRIGSIYEVLSGVEDGQKIVVAGMSPLTNESKVEVITSGADITL